MTATLPPPGFENWGKLAPQCLLLLLLLLGALAALCGLCCCPKPSTDEINKGKRSRAKLTFLTGCRFFLSNWIVCGHFLPRGDSPFDKAAARGNAGVAAFVFLSGFVTHWAYADKDVAQSRPLVLQYYARRIGRVALTSWVAMTYALALLYLVGASYLSRATPLKLLRCYTFTDATFSVWPTCPDPQVWTIHALVLSWLLYPLTARVIVALGNRLRGATPVLALALVLVGLEVGAYVTVYVGQGFWLTEDQHGMGYFWPPSQLLDFALGAVVAEAAQRRLMCLGQRKENQGATGSYSLRAATADLSCALMLALVLLPPPRGLGDVGGGTQLDGRGARVGWEPLYDHALGVPV